MEKVEAYEVFSRFYDDFIKKNVANLHDKYVDLVVDMIGRSGVEVKSILDCTCGTGILMEKLKKLGYEVYGSDISKGMLEVAKAKGLDVVHGDLRSLNLDRKFDLVLSFDSLGHITTNEEFVTVLKSMKTMTKDGGLLVFDGGTKEKANLMAMQTYTYESEEYSFVWKNKHLSNGRVEVKLEISDKDKNSYIEEFELCGHNTEDIVYGLGQVGLEVEVLTTEELVKKGSFICMAKNIIKEK